MSAGDKPRLELPEPVVEHYPRNVAKQVICELKFPALLDLESSPPRELQAKLRHDFPHYEVGWSVSLDPGSSTPRNEPNYLFRSRDKLWVYSLKASAMTLETTRYVRFSEFLGKLNGIIDASSKHLDLVFFTRVGLRYVNAVPAKQGDLEGWVNPALVSVLGEKRLGWKVELFQEVRGYAKNGSYSFRHGIAPNTQGNGDYIIDTDFYREDVELQDAKTVLTALNLESYGLFEWAIGERAREYMRGKGPNAAV